MPDAAPAVSMNPAERAGSIAASPKWPGIRSILVRLFRYDRMQNEKRHEKRYPYPYLIELIPVAADGCTPVGDRLTVVGKHISAHGLGFYSPAPMPFRHVVAAITDGQSETCHIHVDLSWCRFARGGWYENGGRMIRQVEAFAESLIGVDPIAAYSE